PFRHPAWSLDAMDASNNVLATVSEPALTVSASVPAQTFSVAAAGIMRVRFTSDGAGTSSVPAVIIDDLTMTLAPICGSPDFNADGDSGTDADIEAFFACLSGGCCALCGSAD